MTQPVRSGAGAVVAAALVGCGAAALTIALQVVGWGADQLPLLTALSPPGWLWLLLSVGGGVLVAAPAAALARWARPPAVRAAGRAWLAGATAVALLGSLRSVPASRHEAYLTLLALGALVLGYAWRRRPADRQRAEPGAVLFAVAAGTLVLLPWLWVGALGGVMETALAVAAAAALGWLAATMLDRSFWSTFATSRARLLLVGGPVAAVTLLMVAAGAGASGAQLPLLLVLTPLGFVVAGFAPLLRAPDRDAAILLPPVARPGSRWPVLLLVGIVASGPLALLDPQEVTVVLLWPLDIPFWAAVAATGSLLLALLVALAAAYGLLAVHPTPSGLPPAARPVAATVAGVMLLAGGAVYAGLGQPGLHGDRLFVVLADQADLGGIAEVTGAPGGQAGRDARAGQVYQRLVSHAEASQEALRADLDRLRLAYTPYYLVNALEVRGGPAVRAWLSGRDDVARVLRSQRLRPLPAPGRAVTGTGRAPVDPEWHVALVGADRVWRELGVTGEGIVIGISDSGVAGDHPALAGGFRGGEDSWLDPWNGTTAPTDHSGHGTHALGSAVGTGGIGVAPGAQWTGCVNLDRNLANPARYLDCLQFMLAPYPAGGDPWRDGRPARAAHVLTNSWSCPPIEGCDAALLRPATAALRAAGLYVVVAAGNTGPLCASIEDPPAPYPEVLTVGAVDRERRPAGFSSRGPVAMAGVPASGGKPDLAAPGVAVVSAMPGGGYAALSGTSMATPQVAGVVALMWAANPRLVGAVAATDELLRRTAAPAAAGTGTGCGGPETVVGAGLVDAAAAVRAALDH